MTTALKAYNFYCASCGSTRSEASFIDEYAKCVECIKTHNTTQCAKIKAAVDAIEIQLLIVRDSIRLTEYGRNESELMLDNATSMVRFSREIRKNLANLAELGHAPAPVYTARRSFAFGSKPTKTPVFSGLTLQKPNADVENIE